MGPKTRFGSAEKFARGSKPRGNAAFIFCCSTCSSWHEQTWLCGRGERGSWPVPLSQQLWPLKTNYIFENNQIQRLTLFRVRCLSSDQLSNITTWQPTYADEGTPLIKCFDLKVFKSHILSFFFFKFYLWAVGKSKRCSKTGHRGINSFIALPQSSPQFSNQLRDNSAWLYTVALSNWMPLSLTLSRNLDVLFFGETSNSV